MATATRPSVCPTLSAARKNVSPKHAASTRPPRPRSLLSPTHTRGCRLTRTTAAAAADNAAAAADAAFVSDAAVRKGDVARAWVSALYDGVDYAAAMEAAEALEAAAAGVGLALFTSFFPSQQPIDDSNSQHGPRNTPGVHAIRHRECQGNPSAWSVSEYVFGVRTSKLTRHLGVKSSSTYSKEYVKQTRR
jgi:hypothetical protein